MIRAICRYKGIPITRLNGNVTPMLETKARDAFASGKATATAAGAAI